MNDAFVTFQGWVGNDVTFREHPNGDVASFRVGSTPRVKKNGQWTDGQTSWFKVSCWRALAHNVRDSIKKGEAVVVHGRLRTDVWVRENEPTVTTYYVEATFVGHDLNKGTSSFDRTVRADRAEPEEDTEFKEMIHNDSIDGPQLNSIGEALPPLERGDNAA